MKEIETILINGEEYVKASSVENTKMAMDTNGMEYVCVRTYSAGVHCGFLKEKNGKEVTLINATRIWKWSGAFTLSELSVNGVTQPKDCRFSCEVPLIYLTEAIEIIPMTEKAIKTFENVTRGLDQ